MLEDHAYILAENGLVVFHSPCPEREAFSTLSYSPEFLQQHTPTLIATIKKLALTQSISPRFADIMIRTLKTYEETL